MSDSPNVIWVTLDSVRADHTSMSGYQRDTTPNLLRISNQDSGSAFGNCVSHSSLTKTSSAAILTGTPPSYNTVGVTGDKVPVELTTIPERFKEAGYNTACISRNSYVSSATGLNRGFDRFKWISSSTIHEIGLRTLARYFLNIKKHSAGLSLDTAKHSTPFLINGVAKKWLDSFEDAENPFFLYLHYNEPHRPYYPPLPYLDEYSDELGMSPEEAAEFSLNVHYRLNEIVANGCDLTEEEFRVLHAMYDAEIKYTDEMVGRLFDYVQSGGFDETVFVITADHGEYFGEYGLLSHGITLHDAVIRVPLVLHGLDALHSKESDLVQHTDVMKTLVIRAGGDTDVLEGVNLFEDRREYAFSQRGPTNFEHFYEYNPGFDSGRFHPSTLNAIRTKNYKYQKANDRSELFELPDENKDVSRKNPDRLDKMDTRLSDWLNEWGTPAGDGREGEFSDAMKKQLRDLGYLE